jgi:hypothetical protein
MGDLFEFAIPCHPFNPQIRDLLKLGWLRGYAGEVRVWSYFQRVVKDAEEEIKRAGLSRTSWRRIKRRLIGESKLSRFLLIGSES